MRCTMRWLVGGIRPMQRSTILSSTIRWEWLTPKFRPTLEFGRPGVSERRSAVAVLRTGILPALLVLVMSICLSTSADARRWKWWHYYSSYERSVRSGDDDRRREVHGPAARAGRGGAALGAIAERLISGCRQQSAELANLPFDTIARIAAPDDAQHAALDALRGIAREAAERFASDCPQSVPAGPAVRLEAMEQAVDAARAAFNVVEPALQRFYSALDDEQKARLLRDIPLADAAARPSERTAKRYGERSGRRSSRWRAYASADHNAAAKRSDDICEEVISALRGWPIREIEASVRLSEPQRASFYELVTSPLKAADTLAGACPPETALTPVARMATLRARLAGAGSHRCDPSRARALL
jgi:LTXXQ motif family protein